jgi:hypothetical protein
LRKGERELIKIIGDTLSNAIFADSQDNLSSIEFAGTEAEYEVPGIGPRKKSDKRKWSITNKNGLKSSGYRRSNKSKLEWVVGYNSDYAYANNYGQPPGVNIPFDKLYDWAWYRKREPEFPDLKFPGKKSPYYKKFMKFYNRYKGKMISGHRLERKVFMFAYVVMLNAKKNGIEPSFFFTDAVYKNTRAQNLKRLITNALSSDGRFRVETN